MKNEYGHSLGAALRLDQGKNEVFSDGFCTPDALCLCGSIDLEIFAEETKNYSWLSIRQAHNNDGLAIKYEHLLLNRMKILLFVQHAPRRGNVSGITLFIENREGHLALHTSTKSHTSPFIPLV